MVKESTENRNYENSNKNSRVLTDEQQRGFQTDLSTFNSSTHKKRYIVTSLRSLSTGRSHIQTHYVSDCVCM